MGRLLKKEGQMFHFSLWNVSRETRDEGGSERETREKEGYYICDKIGRAISLL